MSSIRDPAYITDTGQTMMTAGGDITYTKAVLYGQDISNLRTDQIKALTTIGNPLRETQMGVSGKKDTDGHTTVILEATFQNNNLKADMPYTAVGFFAKKDDKEKLVAVAVANDGACLAATSPDGIATDALDIKLGIAIGDATTVKAVIDPAGSVTPATLNGAISKAKQELTTQIETKADKATVDGEISKIDFTPYAKTADVDDKLATKADQTALDTTNKSVSDLQTTVATKASSDDLATLQQTIKTLQELVNQQAATITSLQNTVSNQTQEIAYIKANYIEGKRFSKADEASATKWEQENSQRIAFITDN